MKKTLCIRVESDLLDAVKIELEKNGHSMTWLLVQYLKSYLREQENEL